MQLNTSDIKKLLPEIYKIVGFGFLSLVLSKMQFVVPGAVGGLSDMREIALIVGIFYLNYWPSVIILSLITSLGLHEGGSFIATFSMHAIGLVVIYFLYRYLNNKIAKRFRLISAWVVVVIGYFYLLLIPIMGLLHYLLGIIEINQFLAKYIELTKELRLEVIMTTTITSLYLLYLKTTKILEIQNEDLTRSMQKAEESEKLKSAFLQNLSHEIRTPLNGILGFSRLLGQPSCEQEQTKLYTKHIIQSGNQLLNIVNDVVDASHIETKQTKLLLAEKTVQSIFDEVIHSIEPKGKDQIERINIILNGCANAIVESDSYKLTRIYYHLIENALKFSTDKVDVAGELTNNSLKISIADKGIGIDDSNANDIFRKFRQVDRELNRDYGGNGLGLAVVKGFVDELNGKVWFKSIKGKETVFFVEVPVKSVQPNKTI